MKKEVYFITFDKLAMRLIKIGIIVAALVMLVSGGCVIAFTVSQWKNSHTITQAQASYYKALEENVGKPQIIEQRYFSPQNNK
jgi:hypoxanthine phosphoribosyltransferase